MSLKQDFAELVKSQSEIWRAQTKDYQNKLEYSGEQARADYKKTLAQLESSAEEARKLFEQAASERPLVVVLAEMERHGIRVDPGRLEAFAKELERDLDNLTREIYQLAGEEFTIASPKQLAQILFEKLKLPVLRRTKTGYSTDEDVLTQLAVHHELPAEILNYRSLSKLKSTYVDALPQLINPETKRLHTSLNQTVAATGRLSSTEPNLQNIPVKGDYGLRIREAFIAPKGHELLCADYSQIEPRILAHLSGDEALIQAFAAGERAYDQLFQEVALQNLPVVFAMDRAGIVGPDGAVAFTHEGELDWSDAAARRRIESRVDSAPFM